MRTLGPCSAVLRLVGVPSEIDQVGPQGLHALVRTGQHELTRQDVDELVVLVNTYRTALAQSFNPAGNG